MNSIVLHILMSTHLFGMLSDMILHRSLSVTTSRGHSTGTRFSALAKMFFTSRVAKMFPLTVGQAARFPGWRYNWSRGVSHPKEDFSDSQPGTMSFFFFYIHLR